MIMYLDPGETTGWAMYSGDFSSGQLPFVEMGNVIADITRDCGGDLLIGWEAFIIGGHTARKPGSHWAIEMIGVVRYHALRYGCTILPSYPSSSLPPDQVRDKQLKRLGWHKPGRTHANDAAIHLMHYMITKKHMPVEMLKELVGVKEEESNQGNR